MNDDCSAMPVMMAGAHLLHNDNVTIAPVMRARAAITVVMMLMAMITGFTDANRNALRGRWNGERNRRGSGCNQCKCLHDLSSH